MATERARRAGRVVRRPGRWRIALICCALSLSCGGRKSKRRKPGSPATRTAYKGIPLQAVSTPDTTEVLRRLGGLLAKPRPPVDLRVTATAKPIAALMAGKAGLAMMSQPPTGKIATPRRARPRALLLGADTVAVLANTTNPIDHLSMDDLRRILAGRVSNWREVRGPKLGLIAFTLPQKGDLGRLLLQRVTRGKPFDIVVRQVANVPTLLESIRRTPGAIGLVALYQLPKAEPGKLTPRGLKMLALTPKLGIAAYLATDRVAALKGQYPLLLPVTLLSRVAPQHKAAAAVSKLLDPKGRRQLVAQLGLIPLEAKSRAKLAKAWERYLR